MRSRIVLVVLAALTAVSSAQVPLKIATYNMQGMRPGTNWQVRLFFMIQALEDLDPDVICLQEINETLTGGGEDNMARTIAAELEEHFGIPYHFYFTQTHIAWDEFREGVGLVSKYPVLQQGFRSLPRGTFLRKAAWMKIDSPLGPANVFSTHLSYGDQHAVRVQQTEALISYVAETEGGHPSIGAVVGGDFNTTPNSEPILMMLDHESDLFFYDSFGDANPGATGYTMPADNPTARIDYLFFGNSGSLVLDTSYIVMDTPYDGSNFTSDHLGVMTIFTASETSAGGRSGELAPRRVELLQNFPNPFNSQTTIRFKLLSPGNAQFRVTDILGRQVLEEELLNLQPGTHEILWDGQSLASGHYIYTLVMDELQVSRKSTFIK